MSSTYVHTLNPFAIELADGIGVRWYGLSYLAGFLVGYLTIRWVVRRSGSPLPLATVGDFVFSVAIGTIVGGRLGYCIFYNPTLWITFDSSFPFWGVLALNQGGMASHGGIAGIILACYFFGRKHSIPMLHLMDLTTFAGAIGIFFGRIANFVNGELVGRVTSTDLAWAVKFPQDITSWPLTAPERLATLAPLTPMVNVPSTAWQEMLLGNPASAAVERVLYRIVGSIQHGNDALAQALAPLLDARHPSQLYQALLEGLGVAIILLLLTGRKRPHGFFAGVFLTSYAVMRIIGEAFRLPDVQIGYQLFGLTRGQWLSVALVGCGLGLLWFVQRRARVESR